MRELKNHLSQYLRRVQAGEELVITSRGRPVGRLSPPRRVAAETEAQALARLNALPWVRPGSGDTPRGSDKPMPWKPGEKTLSDLVLEDRE